VRVIAATNRDLRQEVKAGRFRGDLYHRLSVFAITVPPLRDLDEDKQVLLDHFRMHYAGSVARAPFELDADSARLWHDYGFPGNVRELRNIVIRLATKYPGMTVTPAQLLPEMDVEAGIDDLAGAPHPSEAFGDDDRTSVEAARRHLAAGRGIDLDRMLRSWERSYIDAALFLTHGNLAKAARLLGLHRTTLYSRMQAKDREDLAQDGPQ
jgi:transcriptional regulator with GAF, ATPase, and Fis domain